MRSGHPDCVSSFAGLPDSTVRCSDPVPCHVAPRCQPAGVQPARRGPTPPPLTSGAAASVDPERRGAALALHSLGAYAGGFVGPIVIGWTLDLSGGTSAVGWRLAFLHVAAIALLGEVALMLLGPRDLGGDR